jgi:hypothetical protein
MIRSFSSFRTFWRTQYQAPLCNTATVQRQRRRTLPKYSTELRRILKGPFSINISRSPALDWLKTLRCSDSEVEWTGLVSLLVTFSPLMLTLASDITGCISYCSYCLQYPVLLYWLFWPMTWFVLVSCDCFNGPVLGYCLHLFTSFMQFVAYYFALFLWLILLILWDALEIKMCEPFR